jgi:hypothetical protein
MIRLGVRKDMAVECPRPWIVAVDDDVIPLAGRECILSMASATAAGVSGAGFGAIVSPL